MQHMAMDARQTADKEAMRGKMLGKGLMDHAHDPCMQPLVAMVHTLYPEVSEEA